MAKFHIHPVTGTPAPCRAHKQPCPFGYTEDQHYSSRDQARAGYEKLMETSALAESVTKGRHVERLLNKLLEAQIARTSTPDALAFLKRAAQDIEADSTYSGLNRLNQIYRSVVLDDSLSDQDDVVATAFMLDKATKQALTVRELEARLSRVLNSLERMKGSSSSFILDKLESRVKDKEHELSYAEDALSRALEELETTDLNREAVYTLESDQELTLPVGKVKLTKTAAFEKLEKELANLGSNTYVGTAAEATQAKLLAALNSRSSELLANFIEDGEYTAPDRSDGYELNGFISIGAGAEQVALLDEESGMVFKIRHDESWMLGLGDSYGDTTVLRVAEAYNKLDRERLSEDHSAEYVETYFLSTQAGDSTIGVVVQPYLDPAIYTAYDPTDEEKEAMSSLGLSDIHSQNVMVNKQTKRVVLFDCFFEL